MKKSPRLALFMSIILLLNLFAVGGISSFAEGTTDVPFDPWYGYTAIQTPSDLDNIRHNLDGKYYLANDIVFTEADFAESGAFYNNGEGWLAFGDDSHPFTGVFDGRNQSITGLKMTPQNHQQAVALFAANSGTIRRVSVEASIHFVYTIDYDNSIIRPAILTSTNQQTGTVENCSTSGSIIVSLSYKPNQLNTICTLNGGGMMESNWGTVKASSNHASISIEVPDGVTVQSAGAQVGGICGDNRGLIFNSYNTGSITKNYAYEDGSHLYDNCGYSRIQLWIIN